MPGVDFEALDKVVHMITDPTTSELYGFSLKVIKQLTRINEETERAAQYWKVEKCAHSGYILGNLILEVQQTEASTVEVLGIGANAAANGIKKVGGQALKSLFSFFGGPGGQEL